MWHTAVWNIYTWMEQPSGILLIVPVDVYAAFSLFRMRFCFSLKIFFESQIAFTIYLNHNSYCLWRLFLSYTNDHRVSDVFGWWVKVRCLYSWQRVNQTYHRSVEYHLHKHLSGPVCSPLRLKKAALLTDGGCLEAFTNINAWLPAIEQHRCNANLMASMTQIQILDYLKCWWLRQNQSKIPVLLWRDQNIEKAFLHLRVYWRLAVFTRQ